jgi:hypothetical protein
MAAKSDPELARASWVLALFCGDSLYEMHDGTDVDLQSVAATVCEGARRLARATMLRDQALAVAERRARERDSALAERDAAARELARVLAEREAGA